MDTDVVVGVNCDDNDDGDEEKRNPAATSDVDTDESLDMEE
jgi:hypothetical protein